MTSRIKANEIDALTAGAALSINATPTFTKAGTFSDTLSVGANLSVTKNIIASANVGIGTSSPGELLEVNHATAPAIQLNRTNDGGFKSILRQQGNDFEIRGSSGSTKIYTGNADGDSSTARLTIDASGNVLKPAQPCFLVRLDASSTAMDIETVPFDHVHVNIGSHFNTSNYRFTAPVAGNYYLSYSVRVNHTTSGHIIHPAFKINGTNDSASLTIHKNDTTGQYMATTFSYVRNLSASDYVTFSMSSSSSGGNIQSTQCHMSGCLLA